MGAWLVVVVVAGQVGPAVVGNCVERVRACVRVCVCVCVCARGGVDLIPTGRGCMSCNTRERRLNFVVPLGRMDGTNCLFLPYPYCIDSGIDIGGISAHACARPILTKLSQSLFVSLEV